MLGNAGATFRARPVCQGWALGPSLRETGQLASFRLVFARWRSWVPNRCSIPTRWR